MYLKIGVVIIAVYLVAMGYMINKGLHDIKISAYNIGCMSVPDAPYESIRECKARAEDEVGDGKR